MNGRIEATRFGSHYIVKVYTERGVVGGETGETDDFEVCSFDMDGIDLGDLLFGAGWIPAKVEVPE